MMTNKWISTKDELPKIGQKVILFSNGVVQDEMFELEWDDCNVGGDYYWFRDDLDECPITNFKSDMWMPLPEPPTQED